MPRQGGASDSRPAAAGDRPAAAGASRARRSTSPSRASSSAISNAAGTLGGKLRLHRRRVAGGHRSPARSSCVSGGRQLRCRPSPYPASRGAISRDARRRPVHGRPEERSAGPGRRRAARAGADQRHLCASPRSACLGGTFQLNGTGLELHAGRQRRQARDGPVLTARRARSPVTSPARRAGPCGCGRRPTTAS